MTLQKNKHESADLAWDLAGEVVQIAQCRNQPTVGCVIPRKRKTYRNLE